MISSDVRRAIERAVAAAGLEPADPGLRPTGTPGQFASSVAFAFGEHRERVARRLAAALADTELPHTGLPHTGLASAGHRARAEVTGPGFITITVPPEALAVLPGRIAAAGPACAASDALRDLTVSAPAPGDPLAALTWDEARSALAAQLTAGLAAAAGATIAPSRHMERAGLTPNSDQSAVAGNPSPRETVAGAVAFAGRDAVRFSLARAVPGRPVVIDGWMIARHVLENPAYAVRYAHARAASGVRWAGVGGNEDQWGWPAGMAAVLLDALAWLPERVATAARRGRPDEFARYLEELASATIAALISAGEHGSARAPGTDRLSLALAARTGLAAGLRLIGVSAPERM